MQNSPLVSVMIPTFNRCRFLPLALASAVEQDYANLEIFVVNDGGEDVSDIVASFNDPRIVFINRQENRGKAYSLNEALARARGKYVCYLDDDDVFYSYHVRTLVDVLENNSNYQVAYSDLYKVYCNVLEDGQRKVLSKVIEVSRDFDRYFMFYFNHCLHVSVMHRRDLLEKSGLYNENISILIDWDIARRFAFFTDFYHVNTITAEFYSPVENSDRISVKGREDLGKYKKNLMAIRNTRPPKPWPFVRDLSIILDSDRVNKNSCQTIGKVVSNTFYPYQLYIPMPAEHWKQMNVGYENLINVDVDLSMSRMKKIDKALQQCPGEFVAILPDGYQMHDLWVEAAVYSLDNSDAKQCFELERSTENNFAVVARKDDLMRIRHHYPDYSLRDGFKAEGFSIKKVDVLNSPFHFDNCVHLAIQKEQQGDWRGAVKVYEYLVENYENDELWVKTSMINACVKAGYLDVAKQLSEEVNSKRPTVNTLLKHAKICRKTNDYVSAIKLLEKAESTLKGKEPIWI